MSHRGFVEGFQSPILHEVPSQVLHEMPRVGSEKRDLGFPGQPRSHSTADMMCWLTSLFVMKLTEHDHMHWLVERRLVTAEQAYEACAQLGYSPKYQLQTPPSLESPPEADDSLPTALLEPGPSHAMPVSWEQEAQQDARAERFDIGTPRHAPGPLPEPAQPAMPGSPHGSGADRSRPDDRSAPAPEASSPARCVEVDLSKTLGNFFPYKPKPLVGTPAAVSSDPMPKTGRETPQGCLNALHRSSGWYRLFRNYLKPR